jgi:hypothetical protein
MISKIRIIEVLSLNEALSHLVVIDYRLFIGGFIKEDKGVPVFIADPTSS